MTLAVVWHWWIAIPLTVGAVLLILATIGGYINKVLRPQYPRKK
ncbi:MAG: hypothetical protein OEU32_02055 [Acidimicrobiia bacterium]|nr:hypothetical protein [Acidimicrobiia bacterium]